MNFIKNQIVRCMIALVIGAVLGTVLFQSATALYGTYKTFSAGSKSFKGRSEVAFTTILPANYVNVIGGGEVGLENGAKSPAGYLGVLGEIYRFTSPSTRTLLGATYLLFNESSTSTHSIMFYGISPVSGWSYCGKATVVGGDPANDAFETDYPAYTGYITYQ